MSKTEEYLIEAADQCVAMARAGRDMAEKLEAMSNNLMAKAVELDTARQRDVEKQPAIMQKTVRK
jgi:hypothetical protein